MTQHNDADAVFRSLNAAAAEAGRRAAEINAENGVELYWFADWDDERGVELTVSGQDYAELIDTCFRYCTHVSLSLRFGGGKFALPELYMTPVDDSDTAVLPCSGKVREYLLNTTDDLFGWIDSNGKPEDLTFYRADGSIFFWLLTHEGVCCLLSRSDEDVSGITRKPDWHSCPPEPFPTLLLPPDLAAFRLVLPNER